MSEEDERDLDTEREMESIRQMIDYSEKEGLLMEVLWTLIRSLKPGISTFELRKECWSAMQEWDI